MERKDDETATLDHLRREELVPLDPDGEELSPGTRVGRHFVLAKAGQGGMGTVYTAYDPKLERRVALKILHRRGEERSASTLDQEARALAKLSHPNVVTVHELGRWRGRTYVAMEHVDGTTLAAWLMESSRSWREIVAVFSEAGKGLAAAHSLGMVHHDFKPSNVMISRRGEVRVLDFGLARPQRHSGDRGAVFGTPAYLAPERLSGHPSDPLSDQYSFCAALYEALFERCFAPGTDTRRQPGNPRTVPGWLWRALLRGLSGEPTARHPSMDALLETIDLDRRRHKQRLRWTSAALLALAGSLVATSIQTPRNDFPEAVGGGSKRSAELWDVDRRELVECFVLVGGFLAAERSFTPVNEPLDRGDEPDAWLGENGTPGR